MNCLKEQMHVPVAEQLAKALGAVLSPGALLRCSEPMDRHTTLRVGGPADLFLEPANEEDLAAVVRFGEANGVPILVLGRGSNLLVKDGGIRGIVVCLSQPFFARVEVAGTQMWCGAGARLKAVALAARDHELAGFEFLEGIPGTIGGGLRMNAGAMGSAIFNLVTAVRLVDQRGEILERAASSLGAAYRGCLALKDQIVVGAHLQGRPGVRSVIQDKINEFSRKRWAAQPAAPSAGCAFKNPAQVPAGKLIDSLGLKGARVGGAVVSSEHANFIINEGGATAADVLGLMDLVREKARACAGIELEPEVEIIGE